ncbi:hypothetical protein KA082_01510 [Candidatus Woesebacteria bacterium]|nr:hypothetical protein [Candidatus Woesebacteria bacterium]
MSEKYPYPFGEQVLENRDINNGRESAKNKGRWFFVQENLQHDPSDIGRDFVIKIEPDTLVFVDSGVGVIKFSLGEDGEMLTSNGGIYNPQKGTETLGALIDILQYIAHKTKRKVKYTTKRVNTTQHLEDKLVSLNFKRENGEFTITLDSDFGSKHQYPEIDRELKRLGFLKNID